MDLDHRTKRAIILASQSVYKSLIIASPCTMLFGDTSKQGVILDVVLKYGDYLKGWISAETEIRYLSKPVLSS
jgi:hypothetical protein